MDCFRIPSVLTEALDQQAARFSLSFTLLSGFSAQLPFWEGRVSLSGMLVEDLVAFFFFFNFLFLWCLYFDFLYFSDVSSS